MSAIVQVRAAGARKVPAFSAKSFRTMAISSLVLSVLIVLTGAAVRLTGSGLGCPDWPSCYGHRLTAQLSYHPLVEFGNRLVTVVLVVVLAATLLVGIRRRPYRKDLVTLSGALVGGVVAQAVLGGIIVYTKLNPYLVMCHFLLSMLIVATAVVMVHRSSRSFGPGARARLVPASVERLAWVVTGLLAVVLAAGTATTGAGPHAGGSQGQLVAKRLPIALRDMAEVHSTLAVLLASAAIGLAVAVHASGAPERVRRAARVLTIVVALQGAVGYSQYFTHLPGLLVEIHVAGATALVFGVVHLLLSLSHHPREAPAWTLVTD